MTDGKKTETSTNDTARKQGDLPFSAKPRDGGTQDRGALGGSEPTPTSTDVSVAGAGRNYYPDDKTREQKLALKTQVLKAALRDTEAKQAKLVRKNNNRIRFLAGEACLRELPHEMIGAMLDRHTRTEGHREFLRSAGYKITTAVTTEDEES